MVSVLDWWSGFDWWPHSCCGGKVCLILHFHVKDCSAFVLGCFCFVLGGGGFVLIFSLQDN